MTTRQIFGLSLGVAARTFRRWLIRRQLANIRIQLDYIQRQRENDRHVERILMGREAVLRSDLRNI